MFSNYGKVHKVKIIYDRITRESRCFGFVEMPNDEEAQKAIAGLHESELDEYTITVQEAEPPKKKFKIRF
jgi:RNA recognition motif-containing protein